MDGWALLFSGGHYLPILKTHTTPMIITPTMAAAAALLWKPSEAFAPTILHPMMPLDLLS